VIFKSPPVKKLIERLNAIWGKKLSSELIEIETGQGPLRLKGLIIKPGIGRSTRQEMVTMVNSRLVESKTLSYALIEAYHTYVPKGRYPVAFLFLELNPAWVDVNVHPAKREVRFREEGRIRQFVIESLLDCLSQFARSRLPKRTIKSAIEEEQCVSKTIIKQHHLEEVLEEELPKVIKERPKTSKELRSPRLETSSPSNKVGIEWRYIGSLGADYALFEIEGAMVVMNVLSGRQRIFSERIKKNFKEGDIKKQPLLFPIPVELEPLMATVFERYLNKLNDYGFNIEIFGRNFYRIEAVPSWMNPSKAEGYIRDVAELLKEEGGNLGESKTVFFDRLAQLALRKAISFESNALKDAVAINLVNDLMDCENTLTSPGGHPTYFELTKGELARRFGK